MRIVFFSFLLAGICANAQVKIGDNATSVGASSLLELESSNKALVLTRVATTAAITTPTDGMLVYDNSSHCIKIYENNAWSGCYEPSEYAVDYLTLIFKGVRDRQYGDKIHDFIYLPITGEDGRIWLNNNLGADYSNTAHTSFNPQAQASAYNDHHAYGSLFQWGRKADGHELISWSNSTSGSLVNATTTTNSDVPTNALFIIETSAPFDWRINQENTLWAGALATNNPCPSGYRIPTDAELTTYAAAASITNRDTAASADAAFTSPGYVSYDAFMSNTGTRGYYWSSTADGTNSFLRYIDQLTTNSNSDDGYRANGYSVRCIKD